MIRDPGLVLYLKPQINSFRSNIVTRNPTSTMSDMDIELNGADQTASTEAKAAKENYV